MENIRKYLFIGGLVLILAALFWPWISKLNIGKLPGDVVVQRGNATFYFPIVTSIIASIVLSIVLWMFRK